MPDIKNEFYTNLEDTEKEKYEILFRDNVEIEGFNESLENFIRLQISYYEVKVTNDKNITNTYSIDIMNAKNVIDLSFIYFPQSYDFTDKNSSLNKILTECKICEYYNNGENKLCSEITKRISFANAIFKKQTEFIRVTFEKKVSFEGTIFLDNVNFQGAIFKEDTESIEEKLRGTIFEGAKFKKEAFFNEAIFKDKAKFFRTKFNDYTSFNKTKFCNDVSFENAISKDLFYFHDVSIGKLDLIGFHYEKANFLILTNIDETNPTLTKNNFENKDTARIIKAHFEQQNNITETNDYFVIEQEFYLNLLYKENTSYSNKTINIISLYFNKFVSNYGTDWVRVLIVMFGFGFLASLFYLIPNIENSYRYMVFTKEELRWQWIGFVLSIFMYVLYISYGKLSKLILFFLLMYYIQATIMYENLYNTTDKIITLINPLNIFNQDIYYVQNYEKYNHYFININYFENIAFYGVIVKGVAITLIYQFIISFRNSTRRK
jgi:hypothetical protein